MRKMLIFVLVCLATLSQAATTISGNLKDYKTVNVTSRAFVRFTLVGCKSGFPRVIGTAAIPPKMVEFRPNAYGVISGSMYGNDVVSCGGSTNTRYSVAVFYDGVNSFPAQEFLISGPTWSLNSASPSISVPSSYTPQVAVKNPVGDQTIVQPPNTDFHIVTSGTGQIILDGYAGSVGTGMTDVTCSGTDKLSSIVSGIGTCTPDQTGVAGTGITTLNGANQVSQTFANGTGIAVTTNTGTGVHTIAVSGLTKSDVGLGNVDNTADSAKNVATAVTLASGSDRTKLDGIAAGAEVNVNADWNAVSGDAQILNKPNLVDTAAEVVGLFNTGTCSGYLKSDGTCDTPAAAATIASTSSVLKGDGSGNAVAAVAGTDFAAIDATTTVNGQSCALGSTCTVTAAPTAHVLNSASHTVSGLTTGQPLQATAANTFGFGALNLGNSNAVTGSLPWANQAHTAANVVGLFNSGTCSGYLKNDGTCDTPVGAGDVTDVNVTTSSPLTGGATCASGTCAFTLGLSSSSTSVNGQTCALGGTCTVTASLPADPAGCTNQVATDISAAGVLTCSTITSAMVNTTIAKTGTDINTSNQVTATHLASALPVNQGGTGTTSTLTGFVRGNASAMTATELSGAVTTSGSGVTTLASKYAVRVCEDSIVGTGASGVLLDTDDDPSSCLMTYGATFTITSVKCYADAGSPTVTPIVTGGSSTSILTGALTCGTGTWTTGTLNGTPTVANNGSIDFNITSAGGTAKKVRIVITGTI